MNLRKTLLAGALSLGLLGSIAAPGVFAEPADDTSNNTAPVEVVITGTGEFDAYLCSVAGGNWSAGGVNTLLTNTQPTAGTAGYAQGSLFICYDDTLPYRANFNTQIVSTAFTSGNALAQTPIGASNFKVKTTYTVIQNQYGIVNGIDIGDIGFFAETGYVAQSTNMASWSADSLRSLEQARTVGFGYAGAGTIFSWAAVNTELNIPAGTAPGTYTSTVTLTIIPGTQ